MLSYAFYFNVFKHLLLTDFSIFMQVFKDKFINLFIWVGITAAVMGYVMPAFGLAGDYGSFQLAGLLASAGLFEVFPSVMSLVSDFEGDRMISYHLTLPIPSWLVLVKTACFYALSAMILTVCVLPMGKLVLWNQFDLSQINYFRLATIVTVTGSFFGIFTLWITSMVTDVAHIGNVWMRFIFPLWFLGGFQFSWKVLHGLFPWFAYINLANPMIYTMEATRVALLGNEPAYLPFWVCVVAIIGFKVLFATHALVRLKKRLDFV